MRLARRARSLVLVAAIVIAASACSADWSQWGGGPDRQGANTVESQISNTNASQLHQLWSADLGGYINAAPIEAGDMPVLGGTHDMLYVGTEQGEFYGITTDGQVVWHRNLGTHVSNCPDVPGGTYGVQASAVFDRTTNRVYAMGGAGNLYALDPVTGSIVSGWPVTISTDPVHDSFYGAPNLFNGFLYIGTASYCDQAPYKGRIVRVDTQTLATTTWYANGTGPTGSNGAGIWGWGGVSVDPADGNVYAATGNLLTSPENAPYGDSIVRLTPDLGVVASNTPGVLIGDDDFGSTPVLFQKPGCPPELLAEQKNGHLDLYNRDTIASGPMQTLAPAESGTVQAPTPVEDFIGVSAYDPKTQMVFVADPNGTPDGFYTQGMVGYRINSSCALTKVWSTTAGHQDYVVGTPTIANGVVYYADGGHDQVHAFDAVTGQELWNSGTDVTSPMFTEPSVVNGQLFMGAYDNKLHAWGL